MPEFSVEFWAAAVLAVITMVLGLGVTLAMDAKTKGEFRFAVGCFVVSAATVVYGIVEWDMKTDWTALPRVLIAYLLIALAVGLTGEAIRWARGRHIAASVREEGGTPTKSEAAAYSAPVTPPHIPVSVLPSAKKKDKFATVVPFNPANKNVTIPMNTAQSSSPSEGFYRDLMGLADRPEKQANGAPWPVERDFTSEDLRSMFIGRLLQYYIFRSIDELERDSEGIEWTREGGSKPLVRVGITPPDRTPYPTKSLFAELSKSEFFGARDQMIWKVRSVDLPAHTHFSLLEQPSSPKTGVAQYAVRFERPGYFLVDFVVTQTLGPITVTGVTGASVPRGFQPSPGELQTTMGYPFIVTMTYEIHRASEVEFSTEDYTKWADGLFAALKQRMASD